MLFRPVDGMSAQRKAKAGPGYVGPMPLDRPAVRVRARLNELVRPCHFAYVIDASRLQGNQHVVPDLDAVPERHELPNGDVRAAVVTSSDDALKEHVFRQGADVAQGGSAESDPHESSRSTMSCMASPARTTQLAMCAPRCPQNSCAAGYAMRRHKSTSRWRGGRRSVFPLARIDEAQGGQRGALRPVHRREPLTRLSPCDDV